MYTNIQNEVNEPKLQKDFGEFSRKIRLWKVVLSQWTYSRL